MSVDSPTATAAFEFIDQYACAAVRRSEARFGPLPGWEWRDVAQETHLELLHDLGVDYALHIENARECGYRLTALWRAVTRALGRARSVHDKRIQRGLPQVFPSLEGEGPAVASEIPLLEMTLDLQEAVGRLGPLERRVWKQLCQSRTVRSIAPELGLDFRRVAELGRRVRVRIARQLAVMEAGRVRREAWGSDGAFAGSENRDAVFARSASHR